MDSTLASSSSRKDLEVSASKQALFFNYHEFSVTRYIDIGDTQETEHTDDQALCITHFPNVYCALGSLQFRETRLVRIPRRFEFHVDIPEFSTQLPGQEPAALVNSATNKRFVARGIYQGQVYGLSSVSPLSGHLSDAEFQEIVETVNAFLRQAYTCTSKQNFVNAVLDTLTFHLWNVMAIRMFKSPLLALEDYVRVLNASPWFYERKLRLISPRRSGYLSVC
ncbi:LAME_0F19350g1_1 [Lachancea meyersii CBS 8951]|uniref:Ras modification protein ERF4 n=1 Tax=Lachancea meyersii CBS 8951 TaxID=1266667 RepID=A0A1G4K1B9_9SACH|nr:LAME_0F19350g1_1 [Lachancea meyersii CBS 8951]